jgi:tetratricopeptide (TPR) repeat protein
VTCAPLGSLTCLVLAALTAAQREFPELPLTNYPAPARAAIEPLYQEARKQSAKVDTVERLARMLHAWEQWEAAHDLYERVQATAPRAFAAWYLDGVVLQRLAKPGAAAERFGRALALEPGNLPARSRRAETLFEAGDVTASADEYRVLLNEPAAEPIGALGLGRIAARQGRHEEAISYLQRAVRLFPEFGAAHYALALSLRATGRVNEARQALTSHQQFGLIWPAVDDPVLAAVAALRDSAGTHLAKGLKLAERGDIAGAIAEHEAALASDPGSAQAHANLISLYGRVQNWAKSEEHYRAVLALGFNRDEAHYNYGVLLSLQERWKEAAAAYREALAANPQHAQAHNNLGQVLERERLLDQAEQEYRAAVAAQPSFRLARFNLGRMLIALDRATEAIAELEPLRTPRDAEAPRYLFALATAHLRAGHKDEALSLARDARQLAADHGQTELAASIDRDLARLR